MTLGKRHFHSVVLWALLFAGLAAAVGGGLVLIAIRSPFKGYSAPSVLVEIPAGTSTASILKSLEDGGVIRDRRLAFLALRVLHRGKTLKAGEYSFSGPRSAEQVILSLISGDVVSYRITIPEGSSAAEIAGILSSQRFGTEAELLEMIARPSAFPGVPAEAPSLEGFLFPETYTLTRSMTAREILGAMTHELFRRLPPGYAEKAGAARMTLLQAVTLASLVEKETSVPEERPLVAAVYRNRMARGMLMQADPTTIYALKRLSRWRGTLSRSDLLVDEPYNTYVRAGLPPGPICSPGLACLKAAIAPITVNHLFFVAKGDGSHRFASRYEDQQHNVDLYRQTRREARAAAREEEVGPP